MKIRKKKKINNDNANTVIEEIKHQNNSNSTNNEIMNSNISSCEEIHFNFSSLSSSSSIPPIRVTSSISLASVTTDCTLFSELDFSSQDSLHTFSSMEDDDEKEKDNEKTSDKMKEEIIHMQKNEIINDHPRISYSNVSSIHNSSLQIKDSNYETKNGNLFFESISEYNKSNDATDFFSINSQSNFLYNSLPNLNTFSSSTSNYTSCVSYNSFSSSSFAHSSHAESSYPSFVSCSRNQIYSDTLSNYHCITNTSNSFYNCSNDVTNSVSNNNYNKSSTNMYCPSFPSLISSPPFNLNFYSSLQSSPMPTFYPFLIQSIPITTEMLQAACNVQYED